MVTSLRDDIKQKKPFSSLEQEAYLNVLRTATALHDEVELMLKPYGITGAQYNVLRILGGAHPEGLCRNEVRDRMIRRMPDMTRLLDRMEAAGLVERTRSDTDRRSVPTHITTAGRKLIDKLTDAMQDLHKRQLGHLNQKQLATLIDLLTQARQDH